VFGEYVFVKDAHAMTEHDGVRDLHHGGFDMQREHDARLARIFNLALIEGAQGFATHKH